MSKHLEQPRLSEQTMHAINYCRALWQKGNTLKYERALDFCSEDLGISFATWRELVEMNGELIKF